MNKLWEGSQSGCLFTLYKWYPENVDLIPEPTKETELKRNLAELGEIIYKSIQPARDKENFSIVSGSQKETSIREFPERTKLR
ncbi:MAG: hypothetical protein IPM57_02570 [Oligoflexia bacterium]|nr:hypothetical protein [Oligoflexia bacterium]